MTEPFILMLNEDEPMPRLHELRASDPVHRVESLGFWLITRHDDIKRLMYCPEDVTHIKHHWEFYSLPEEGSIRRWVEEKHIFTLDEQDHTRVRRLVATAFSPRAVLRMEQQIQEIINQMAERLKGREGGLIDILGEFTNVVPNAVISRIAGVPPGEDEARFCKIAQAMLLGFKPFPPEDAQREADKAVDEFFTWMRVLVRKRRDQPGEDLVTDLLRAQDADETLTEDDIILLLMALISAGSDATAMVAALVMRAVLSVPEACLRLRNDRSLIPKTIDEIVRYSFKQPGGTMRFAVRDFELRGKQIKKGQMLMLSFAGANFDPEVFENPDELNLDVNATNTMTFGRGPHHCIGANLARKEIASMLDVLLDVLPPGSTVCEDLIEYEEMGVFRFQKSLPVRVAPRLMS